AGIDCGDDCTEPFAEGTQLDLTATPAADSEFAGWTSTACDGTGLCEFTVDEDIELVATFTLLSPEPQNIEVTSTSGGTGGDDCTLRDAITAANQDAAVGGCIAGDGEDTITLPLEATIGLDTVDNTVDGPNGLPSVTSV